MEQKSDFRTKTKMAFKRLLWIIAMFSFIPILMLWWSVIPKGADSFLVVFGLIVFLACWVGICFGVSRLLYGKFWWRQ